MKSSLKYLTNIEESLLSDKIERSFCNLPRLFSAPKANFKSYFFIPLCLLPPTLLRDFPSDRGRAIAGFACNFCFNVRGRPNSPPARGGVARRAEGEGAVKREGKLQKLLLYTPLLASSPSPSGDFNKVGCVPTKSKQAWFCP